MSTKTDEVKVNAPLREIGKKVPALAIRGQIYEERPFVADIGANYGVKNADRLFIYRQEQDENGRYHSRKIAEARAAVVGDTSIVVYPYSGKRPSYKNGDIVSLQPDRGVRNTLTVGYADNFISYTYLFDYLNSVSKRGIGHHLLFSISYSHLLSGSKNTFLINEKDVVKSPTVLSYAWGQGREFTLFNNIMTMPYIFVSLDVITMKQDQNEKQKSSSKYTSSGVSGTFGVQASVKVSKWLNVVGDVGYKYLFYDLHEKGKSNEISYKDFKEFVLKPSGWRCFGLQIKGGVSITF